MELQMQSSILFSIQTKESIMQCNLQCHQRFDMIHLLLEMRKMTWSISQQSPKEVSKMIAQKRNPTVLFQLKELPLVLQPLGRMTLSCQRDGKGKSNNDLHFLSKCSKIWIGVTGRDRSPLWPPSGVKPTAATKPINESQPRIKN